MKALFWVIVAIIVGIVGYFVYDTQIAVPTVVTTTMASTTADLPQIIPDTPSVRYTDPRYHFDLYYPSTATLRATGFEGYLPLTQTPIVGFALNSSMFQGTNLVEAGIYVGATSTPSIVAHCMKPIADAGETEATSSISFSGTAFSEFDSTGVGAGNIYQEKAFRAVVSDSCMEFVELLHSGNIGNYPTGTVTAFDEAHFSGVLDAMLKTLSFDQNSQK